MFLKEQTFEVYKLCQFRQNKGLDVYGFRMQMNLDTLDWLESRPSRHLFDAGDGYHLVIEPHAPGMYRLRIGQAEAVQDDMPARPRARALAEMLLARPEAVGEAELSLDEETQGWLIRQGQTGLLVRKAPFSVTLVQLDDDDRVLPVSQAVLDNVVSDDEHWSFQIGLSDDEMVCGLGQAHDDVDRRGKYIDSSKPEHRALPLAWSPQGWGVYVNTLGRVEHDVASTVENQYRVRAQQSVFDIFLFVAEPIDILNQYTALTGRAGQPLLWAMGIWLRQPRECSTSELLTTVQALRDAGVCLDAVMMREPMAWRFSDSRLALEWDLTRFEDPKATLETFAEANVQLCLPTIPAVQAGSMTQTEKLVFAELEDRGWLLADDDTADAWITPEHPVMNNQDCAWLDLTNRDVYQLWVERHRQLAEEGLGAVSCQAAIPIPEDVTARGGETGDLLRAVYPILARTSLYDACAGDKVPPEGVVLTSDLVQAAQRYPWQSPIPVEQSWEGMRQSILLALTVGSSGVPLQMLALGHEDQDPETLDTELFLRWLAMAVFSGNFQFESAALLLSERWTPEERKILHHWMQWRYRLVPYVLGAIEDATRTGLPVQRSMALSFPQDAQAHVWDTQYMLGPALLVAPTMQPGTTTEIYLPEGDEWWDLSTGWRYEGGQTLSMEIDLDSIAVFGREGHMLCLGLNVNHTGEFNSARLLEEVWMFGMPVHNPVVMRNKIRVMQMQGSSYIKGLEGLKILPSEGLEVKRRGAEVRISPAR